MWGLKLFGDHKRMKIGKLYDLIPEGEHAKLQAEIKKLMEIMGCGSCAQLKLQQHRLSQDNKKLQDSLNECYSTIAALENGNEELKNRIDYSHYVAYVGLEITANRMPLNYCTWEHNKEEKEIVTVEAAGEERQKMLNENFKTNAACVDCKRENCIGCIITNTKEWTGDGDRLICEACTDRQRRECRLTEHCPIEDGNIVEKNLENKMKAFRNWWENCKWFFNCGCNACCVERGWRAALEKILQKFEISESNNNIINWIKEELEE